METERLITDSIREAGNDRKHLENTGIGTKSQQTLQRHREEIKMDRRQISRRQREADARR